jgi:heme/copper-type cytochrome/quinol oxidase subunit 2
MKKFVIFTLVLVLLAVSVVPAYAASQTRGKHGNVNKNQVKQHGKMPFALAGTIASLDPVAGTVTVTVVCGNKLVKPYIGQDLTLQTINTTRFLLRNPDGTATPITFDDLVVGQNVSSNGKLADNVWTANRITVGADLNCLP